MATLNFKGAGKYNLPVCLEGQLEMFAEHH